MNPADITQLRLQSQHINQADFASAHDVVAWMGAMQAQDHAGALWAIALRTPNLTLPDIEAAIEKAEIVRTWPMRGTLHFVAREDIRWIVNLLGPRASQKAATRRRNLNITDDVIDACRAVLSKELGGRKYLSRPAIMALFESAGIATTEQRGLHILGYLAEHGFICFGPHIGKQPSFALLDEWVGMSDDISKDEALQKLARRYFISHGPATEKDFAAWTGLPLTDVRQAVQLAGAALRSASIGDKTYWMDTNSNPVAPMETTYLLPGFDEYMLGYRDRSAALAIEHSDYVVPGGNGVFFPTIVIDGHVVGTWKKIARAKGVTIQVTTFTTLSTKHQASIVAASKRYEAFIGRPIDVIFD